MGFDAVAGGGGVRMMRGCVWMGVLLKGLGVNLFSLALFSSFFVQMSNIDLNLTVSIPGLVLKTIYFMEDCKLGSQQNIGSMEDQNHRYLSSLSVEYYVGSLSACSYDSLADPNSPGQACPQLPLASTIFFPCGKINLHPKTATTSSQRRKIRQVLELYTASI